MKLNDLQSRYRVNKLPYQTPMVNELNKIMEYIRDTKNPVKEDFISAATNHLMNFFNHKGLTYGLIGTGVSVLLYKLCQNNLELPQVNPNMTLGNAADTNNGALTAIIVSAVLGVLGYFYKRNYDTENTQTLPTQQTNPTLPETNHNYNVYKPRNDSRKAVVEINTDDNTDDNKKSSKSLFQSISDYFWPKGTE